MAESLASARYAVDLADFGDLQVLAELVRGNAAEHQNTLRDLIDLFGRVVVHLLELAVQHEKSVSLNVPVKAAEIHVMNLKIGEQLL